MGPMTLIVVLVLVILLAAGVLLILRARRDQSQRGDTVVCERCRSRNPAHAKFCARCGESLG